MGEFGFMAWEVMVARLLMAAAAGAIVGVERERRDHAAGFRTLLLVSVGACLFTLVSIVVAGEVYDPGRIAAGIITGIGFLGAGAIIRHGGSVQGLTTAASIWAVSAVGMAAGLGWWQAVIAGTVLMFLALTLLKWVERRILRPSHPVALHIEVDAARLSLSALREACAAGDREVVSLEISHPADDAETCVVSAAIGYLPPKRADALIEALSRIAGVRSVRMG